MDKERMQLSTLQPPTYNEAVIKESKDRQQNEQVHLQPHNQVPTQLSEEIQGAQQPFNENILGKKPMNIQCPHCQQDIQTKIVGSVCRTTHLMVGLMCLLGCWCCCCIPYYLNTFKDIKHYCPHCNICIGTKTMRRLDENGGYCRHRNIDILYK